MRKFTMLLTAAMLVLGTIAMTASVQAQGLGAAKVCQQLKNATSYVMLLGLCATAAQILDSLCAVVSRQT